MWGLFFLNHLPDNMAPHPPSPHFNTTPAEHKGTSDIWFQSSSEKGLRSYSEEFTLSLARITKGNNS